MARGASKYEPLRAYLAALPADVAEVTLAFGEIEALLGAPLPWTATVRMFWSNPGPGVRGPSQAVAWRRAGWHVAGMRTAAGGPAVTFARGAPPARS